MNIRAVLKRKIPPHLSARLKTISELCEEFGLQPYVVGGIVRDLILNCPLKQDCDVTVVGGDLQELASLLSKKWKGTLFSYPEFLTYTIEVSTGFSLDLITARDESYPYPAALPVVKRGTLETDLVRRDFGINAVAFSLSKTNWGELIDPLGGFSDIKKGVVRVLHRRSFTDDPTRIFRAARFAGRFGFRLDKETEGLIEKSVRDGDVKKLSSGRIRAELEKILLEKNPSVALTKLSEWGVLEQVHEGLVTNASIGKDIDRYRPKDSSPVVRMSLWMRGKPLFQVKDILARLNFSTSFREKVLQIAALHGDFKKGKPAISIPRYDLFKETFDCFNIRTASAESKKIEKRWSDYKRWVKTKTVLNGNSLKELGYAPGPAFKTILEKLAVAKFKGKARDKNGEIRFVIDNFRRD